MERVYRRSEDCEEVGETKVALEYVENLKSKRVSEVLAIGYKMIDAGRCVRRLPRVFSVLWITTGNSLNIVTNIVQTERNTVSQRVVSFSGRLLIAHVFVAYLVHHR